MKTIETYQKAETSVLQSLLKEYERNYERNEILIDMAKENYNNYDELQKINDDYDIDIHLIRMELNKRLWKGEF